MKAGNGDRDNRGRETVATRVVTRVLEPELNSRETWLFFWGNDDSFQGTPGRSKYCRQEGEKMMSTVSQRGPKLKEQLHTNAPAREGRIIEERSTTARWNQMSS